MHPVLATIVFFVLENLLVPGICPNAEPQQDAATPNPRPLPYPIGPDSAFVLLHPFALSALHLVLSPCVLLLSLLTMSGHRS